jgi:hypothetical protein
MSAASHLSYGLGWDDARRSSLDCASAQILATHEDGDPAMDITIRRESQRLGSADTISVQNREMR